MKEIRRKSGSNPPPREKNAIISSAQRQNAKITIKTGIFSVIAILDFIFVILSFFQLKMVFYDQLSHFFVEKVQKNLF